jgi:hypothetical protein
VAPTITETERHPHVEIRGLGGAAFEDALAHLRRGGLVTYRGMELALGAAHFECRVPWPEAPDALTDRRALEALTRARFRLGALLASAPPLAAIVGNREPRLVLVGGAAPAAELFELRGDRLRRLPGRPP